MGQDDLKEYMGDLFSGNQEDEWEKLQFPDHLSKNVRSLLRKMLEWDPKERLSADDCLNHKWFEGN